MGRYQRRAADMKRLLETHQSQARFRGGLVFKAHRLLHHSTLGLRVIKKKKNPKLARPTGNSSPATTHSVNRLYRKFYLVQTIYTINCTWYKLYVPQIVPGTNDLYLIYYLVQII